jgi:poly-gamma-glutamate capsule biosynthesis protein CapA/YwtB (metallophosphatase superfamily)
MIGNAYIILFAIFLIACKNGSSSYNKIPGEETLKDSSNNDSLSSSYITLFLCGDVMIGRGVDQILANSVDPVLYESYVKDARDYVRLAERENGSIKQPVSPDYIWGDALKVWQQVAPDLKIINLETSITDNGTPWLGKGINYRMHPENVNILTSAGIDFSSLANNHVLDWGYQGLLETLSVLKKAGIAYAGAGKDLQEAQEPAILNSGKGRVIIFSYGSETSGIPDSWAAKDSRSGVNKLPDLQKETVDMIASQIEAVKGSGDIVVFSVHWGSNWGYGVPSNQQEFAHRLIDNAGVDIIHGHSSHHPRGVEVYKNKLIIYGAGDFINDYEGIGGHELYRDDLTLMYFPRIDPSSGNLISMKMVPMQIKKIRLRHATKADTKWLKKVLDEQGQNFGTSIEQNEDGSYSLHW